MDLWTNTNMPYLSKMLDVLAQRHRVISNNIANVNTKGYKTRDVAFDEVLAQITDISASADRSEYDEQLKQIPIEDTASNEGFDNKGLNDVDIDREMVKLSTNSLMYKTYVALMTMKLKQVNQALRERV